MSKLPKFSLNEFKEKNYRKSMWIKFFDEPTINEKLKRKL